MQELCNRRSNQTVSVAALGFSQHLTACVLICFRDGKTHKNNAALPLRFQGDGAPMKRHLRCSRSLRFCTCGACSRVGVAEPKP